MLKTKPNPDNASADPVLKTREEREYLSKLLEHAEVLADTKQLKTPEFAQLNDQVFRKTGYYLDGAGLTKNDVYSSIQSIADIELGVKEQPVTHMIPLTWNTLAIATAMQKTMKENGFKTDDGKEFSDVVTFGVEGKLTAFCILGMKSKSGLQIYIENEKEQIRFMGGVQGKYLPKGKQLAQFKKIFKKSELLEASKYFEEMMKVIGVSNEEIVQKRSTAS